MEEYTKLDELKRDYGNYMLQLEILQNKIMEIKKAIIDEINSNKN